MKLIKRTISTVLTLALLIGVGLVAAGYGKYKQAVSQLSIEDAVKKIQTYSSYTELADINPTFKDAMVCVEDRRFYEHKGVDVKGIIRAFKSNFEKKTFAEGGSTITQQLAKNIYFINDDSLTRKVAESFVAFKLETKFSKDEILELYFNNIYYGSGYYRIRDASVGYFGKEPAKMSDYEATLLAGIPNAPSVYSLDNNPDLAKQRQKTVVEAMVENGKLSEEDADRILSQQ